MEAEGLVVDTLAFYIYIQVVVVVEQVVEVDGGDVYHLSEW